MNKYEISNKILKLLDCDHDKLIETIINLADEVRTDYNNESGDMNFYDFYMEDDLKK